MKATKQNFLKLYELKSENDEWDYKKELHTTTKEEKYNIIKDFLAFANFGGGYILIGIDEDNDFSISNVEEKMDPSSIGDFIEFNLGFNIKFEINYFNFSKSSESIQVGIIYVYPSSRILTCPKILQANNNKVIVGVNDILTRRNTKSTKANSQDIENITSRLFRREEEDEIKTNNKRLPIFKDKIQEVNNLWDAINNKFVLNSENIAINLRSLIWYNGCNKSEFAKLIGVETKRFDSILKGEILPQLDELVRISNHAKLELKRFFQPSVGGLEPFWNCDLVKYSILKLVSPVSDISNVKDINEFLGNVVYATARNIDYLHSMLFDEWDKTNLEHILDEKVINAYKSIPPSQKEKFFGELSHQHYKLLEQVHRDDDRGYTKPERTILVWHFAGSNYLARIFTESIKQIKILEKDKYKITFHFWDELIKKKIRGREFDDKNIKMIFSKTRMEI